MGVGVEQHPGVSTMPHVVGAGAPGGLGQSLGLRGYLRARAPLQSRAGGLSCTASGSWVSSLEEATPEAGWSLGVVGGAARGLAREAGGGGWSVALVLPTSATRASVSHL